MKELKAIAYVDGSYSLKTEYLGSAALIFINPKNRPHRIAFKRKYPTLSKYGSNISEINAVKIAIKTAQSHRVTDLTIYYDWVGLEHFSHRKNIKPHHLVCPIYSQYADYIEQKCKTMKIRFVKVKAHADDRCNNITHHMAKSAINI